MSATKIFLGPNSRRLLIVLTTTWTATAMDGVADRFQPQLGPPWFELFV